jgi:OmcA/MtrC family decaheme c-type cytochrome
VGGPTDVTVTASAGGASAGATFTVVQAVTGGASRISNPNPLDLGRLVHRIHRGRNLPTLYQASSIAPAPALPPGATAFPLPFLPGRNPPAPGARWSVVGFRGAELVGGEVVTRADNGQPARTVVEGIAFPRDLRDCDACHQGAPQQAEVGTAASRRTCQGCHPEVWYGTAPITDLVHFAHTGGPQADDSKCAGCHVSPPAGQALLAPIAAAHLPLVKSPSYNGLTVTLVSVTDLQPGKHPTVVFTVRDEVAANGGFIDALSAPVPAKDFSPLPRAVARLAITLAGPSGDYLNGNAPLTEVVPAAATAAADGSHRYAYTFAAAIPAGASGTWAVGLEARRQGTVPMFDAAGQVFQWPYTGETITEYADNPVEYVDTAFGSWPGGAPLRRRAVVERARCQACHLDLNLHGGLRHNPDYCLMCHAPDTTDWNRRPKGADGNVNLGTAYPDGRVGTYDDLEERSIRFKVMIHRLHTGAGQGAARIEVGAPQVIYGFGGTPLPFDDVRFPALLSDCTRCHLGDSWTLGAIPPGAAPTTANESATIRHAATAGHVPGEPQLPPMTASCVSCHGTAFARVHCAGHTVAGVEQCAQCHAKGSLGVAAVHGLPEPATSR